MSLQKDSIRKKEIILSLFFGVLLAGCIFLIIRSLGSDNIRLFVNSWGILSPIIFVILHAITVIFSPFGGGGVLILSAGVLFGTWAGMLYFILGAFLGAVINFWLGRHFGVKILKYLLGSDSLEKSRSLATKLTLNSKLFLLIILMSTTAFNVLCYACGLSKMPFKNFVLAVLISSLINTPIYIIVGQTLAEPSYIAFINLGILTFSLFLIVGVEEIYNRFFSSQKITWLQQIKNDIAEFSDKN